MDIYNYYEHQKTSKKFHFDMCFYNFKCTICQSLIKIPLLDIVSSCLVLVFFFFYILRLTSGHVFFPDMDMKYFRNWVIPKPITAEAGRLSVG